MCEQFTVPERLFSGSAKMQFVRHGPDIPDALVQAHEQGRVVFFCGTGISYQLAQSSGGNGNLICYPFDTEAIELPHE